MLATIRDRIWRIVEAYDLHGDCEDIGEPVPWWRFWENCRKPVIRIDADLKGRERMETLIHEQTHGAFPDLREEVVEQFAYEMSLTLEADGYGRHEA